MVATASAKWGTFDPETWPGDHVEAVGYNLDNPATPPHFFFGKYDQIVTHLANL